MQDASGRISNVVIDFSDIFSYQQTPSNSAEYKQLQVRKVVMYTCHRVKFRFKVASSPAYDTE